MNRTLADAVCSTLWRRIRVGAPGVIALCAAFFGGAPGATAQGLADLAITKTGPATVNPGQTITYTLTIANVGPDPATPVQVTDVLPAGVTSAIIVSNSNPSFLSCSVSGAGLSCTNSAPSLGSATVVYTVQVSPSAFGAITNTATVSSPIPDPNPNNNSATTTATVQPIPVTPAPLSLTLILLGLGALALFQARRRFAQRS